MNTMKRMIALLMLLLALFSVNTAHAVEKVWSKDVSAFLPAENSYSIETGYDGSCVLKIYGTLRKVDLHSKGEDIFYWFDSTGKHLKSIVCADESSTYDYRKFDSLRISSNSLVLQQTENIYGYYENYFLRFITENSDSDWFTVDNTQHAMSFGQNVYLGYVKDKVLHVVKVGSTSSTSASNTNTSEGSGSDTETATTSTNYELLSSWCYFSEYPWVYSYTNNSWYYLMPSNSGLYAWNENITGDWFNVAAN